MGKDADHAGTALYFPVEPFNMIECPAEPPESWGKAITVMVLPHFYPGKSGFSGSLHAARGWLSRYSGGFVLSSVGYLRSLPPGRSLVLPGH